MLRTNNVVAGYGRQPVLRGVSVDFEPGRLNVLIGPNGCGKSTLLKAIMGFLPLSAGEITLAGQSIRVIGRKTLAREIAYLPQDSHCPDYMTLGELIELAGYARTSAMAGPSVRDRLLFRQVLERVGLADMAHRPLTSLSGGQRQRAWIAMVLAQDTPIILMDEPVNHLDLKYQYAVLELVQSLALEQGKTIVMVLHDINLATTFADEVIMLHDGQVVAKGPAGQVMTSSNVGQVFDLDVDIFERQGRLVCLPRVQAEKPVAA
ncbi:ABC transporter ATP-binding protein [Labrys sp. 22185]|uniref:ABC transporter ATP-binding protein n=1 Tax=Labrys sp. 22185 TaxID=3453888 RepID=UPI003F835C1E